MAGAATSGSEGPSIHASAVLVGPRAVLIRGPSGSGKSRLALALLGAAEEGRLAFARLVSDDRTRLAVAHQRLLARPVPELAGLIEVYGMGIRRVPYEPAAVVFLVVDLAADAPRMPDAASQTIALEGISLPRLAVASGHDPMPLIVSEVRRQAAG
jgi:hypothetical protein